MCSAGFTASKLLWMKRKEPHNFARLQHVLLPHDYVNYWLTGRYCMEAGDASGTGDSPRSATHPKAATCGMPIPPLAWIWDVHRLPAYSSAAKLVKLVVVVLRNTHAHAGFFDLQQRQFSEERMREIDANLHTFMPDLVNPDEVGPRCLHPSGCPREFGGRTSSMETCLCLPVLIASWCVLQAIGVLTGAVASELGLSADVLVAPGTLSTRLCLLAF